jgi:hypothetical protein
MQYDIKKLIFKKFLLTTQHCVILWKISSLRDLTYLAGDSLNFINYSTHFGGTGFYTPRMHSK